MHDLFFFFFFLLLLFFFFFDISIDGLVPGMIFYLFFNIFFMHLVSFDDNILFVMYNNFQIPAHSNPIINQPSYKQNSISLGISGVIW